MCVNVWECVNVCIWNVALSRLSLSRGNGTWSERTQTNKWTGWQRSPTLCIEKLCWTEKCFLFSKTKVYGFCVGLKPFLGMRSKASVTSQNEKIYEFKWNWLAKEAKEEEEEAYSMKFERWDAIAENVSEGEIKWANKRERGSDKNQPCIIFLQHTWNTCDAKTVHILYRDIFAEPVSKIRIIEW